MRDYWPLILVVLLASMGTAGAVMVYKQRGLRNNNPGNLVLTNIAWKGKVPNAKNTDGKFEQFISPHYGLRAMFMDVRGDIEKDGLNTITKLLTSYAPAHENNLTAYISSVSKQTGLSPSAQIKKTDYLSLMKAIIKHENGINPYTDNEIVRAMAS